MLLATTLANIHACYLHFFSEAEFMSISVGSSVDVKLPVGFDAQLHYDVSVNRQCPAVVLNSNASALLILIRGHALEAAQWISREHATRTVSESSGGPQKTLCRDANAPVVGAPSTEMGDRCSRFLRKFCIHEWKSHPRTRHFEKFYCQYPTAENDGSHNSDWFHAQSVGSEVGVCPQPATLLWPPSKVTYPKCSKAIAALRARREDSSSFSSGGVAGKREDLFEYQAAAAPLECPPPTLFQWTPDATLWPECDRWIRLKCAPGSSCSSLGHGPPQEPQSSNITPQTRQPSWSEGVQRSFAEAQNWCAGRGKCPTTLEGRWLPGPLFFPDCSSTIAQWCEEKGVLEECIHPPPTASQRMMRLDAQKWAHMEFNSCPDPDEDFIWGWDLGASHVVDHAEDLNDGNFLGSGLQRRPHAISTLAQGP